MLPLKYKDRYTFQDVISWDEGTLAEIIDGKAFLMASRSPCHQRILGGILCQLADFLEGKREEAIHSPLDVRLFEKDGDAPKDIDTVVQPDILVVCDRSKLDDYGCKGAPDMIVEVLSSLTLRHDRFVKLELYQRAGVREYWIVSPAEHSVQIFLLENGRYILKDVGVENDILRVNILKGCFIDLARVFEDKMQEW